MDWSLRIIFLLLLSSSLVAINKFPDSTVFSKEIWLYLATAVSLFVSSLVLLHSKNRFIIHFLDYFVLGFLIIIPVTNLFLFSDYKSTAIIQQVCIGLCYLSLRIISCRMHYIKIVNLFIQSLLVIFILNIAVGLHQYFGFSLSYYPELGPTGLFFNPGPYAIYLAVLTPWIIVYIIKSLACKKYPWSIFVMILLGLGLFLIVISMARSAWIGLFCGITLPLILFFGNRNLRVISKKIILFASGCIFFYFLLYHVKVDSSNGRILIWSVSSTMIKDHWAKGLGLGRFSQEYMHCQKKYFDTQLEDVEKFKRLSGDVRFAFNDFLQIFIEGGIFTVAIFIFIVISIMLLLIVQILKNRKNKFNKTRLIAVSGIIGSIVVVLTAGLTAYPLQMLPISIFLWVQIFLGVSMLSNRSYSSIKNNKQPKYLIALSWLLASSVLYYGTKKTIAYLHLKKAPNIEYSSIIRYNDILHDNPQFYYKVSKILEDNMDERLALSFLQKAVSYNPCPDYYYRLGRYYEKANDIDKAFDAYDFIDRAIPNLMTPKYLKALLFYKANDTLKFNHYARSVLDFNPKIYNYKVFEMKKDIRSKLKSY